MGSRREEERNEKIIRGLMKLPPNRRCINCNSLGPQYVCTNFWTFVCMTCSGIHREFTHRVKSVSMAKFTSQEVETLQNGGNQRARETFLKNWDAQRQRLPDNSNADKVREFIKNVYEEKKYVGGKSSDKPPRNSQNNRSSEDVRRASSYHSYSQSPPYDYQYEERRYGKQASGFTSSKSTSERGVYGKAASTFYSPGRFSDHMFEDSFANDGSSSRASDFSVSATQSPKLQTESEFSSPTFLHSKNLSSKSLQHQTTKLFPDGQSQRTTSFESVRSFDSSSMAIKSCKYNCEESMATYQDDTSTVPPLAAYGGLDLFNTPATLEANDTKQPTIDLFKLPEAPVDPSNKFQPLTKLFSGSSGQQTDEKSLNFSVPENDGWATFDNLLSVAQPVEVVSSSDKLNSVDSSLKLEGFAQYNTQKPWPPHQSSDVDHFASSTPSPWLKGLYDAPAPALVSSTLSWNAFDDTIKDSCIEGVKEFSDSAEVATYPSSNSELHSLSRVLEGATIIEDPTTGFHLPANTGQIQKHVSSMMEEVWRRPNEIKSTNPFDFPYDSELEYCNTFLDMDSLQAAIPIVQTEPTVPGGILQPWLPPDPVAPCFIPAQVETQDYMGGQGPASKLQSVPTEGHVASIGGNPFA